MGRPQFFTIDPSHQLARGLVFAGLGHAPGSARCFNSAPLDVHGHGVLTNMIPSRDWIWDAYLNRWKLQFGIDGATNHHVITGNSPTSFQYKAISIAVWSYAETAGIGTAYGRMVDRGDLASVLSGNGSSYTLFIYNLTNLNFTGRAYNTWNHVVGTWDGTRHRGYVNGIEKGSGTSTGAPVSYNYPWLLGNNILLNRPHDGFLCDGMVWNRALTVHEIQQLADPSNYMLSGLIKPIGQASNIYDLAGIR